MHRSVGILTFLIFFFAANAMGQNIRPIRVILKYKPLPFTLNALHQQLQQETKLPIQNFQPMAGGAFILTLNRKSVRSQFPHATHPSETVLQLLRRNPHVAYAVKDRVGQFTPDPAPDVKSEPVELSHAAQWDEFSRPGGVMLESAPGLRDGAWAYTTGLAETPVVVAVLDTGIALHGSLLGNLTKDASGAVWGWNFAHNNRDLQDETKAYHGTHVAGIIAGYGDVVLGMGENLRILPIKIPDESGMFYESSVINAIYWALGGEVPDVPINPYPAKVLNMSFGIDERPGKEIDHCDEALQEALWYARKKRAVVVVAAGNDNRWEHYNAPAVCNGTIKVAATGPTGLRAYYSNYGPAVSFAAPGGDLRYGKKGGILSTVKPDGGYQASGFDFYQGTSMASPHVAGVAGLVQAISENRLSSKKVEQILYTTTHLFGESDDSDTSCLGEKPCGHGILDAENAVKAAMAHYDILLSAPSPENLKREGIKTPWIKQNLMNSFSVLSPHVELGENGKIYAYSGSARFVLDTKAFQHCEIIGYDGVGCYR